MASRPLALPSSTDEAAPATHMPSGEESFSILKHSLTDEVARIHSATKLALPSVDDASSEDESDDEAPIRPFHTKWSTVDDAAATTDNGDEGADDTAAADADLKSGNDAVTSVNDENVALALNTSATGAAGAAGAGGTLALSSAAATKGGATSVGRAMAYEPERDPHALSVKATRDAEMFEAFLKEKDAVEAEHRAHREQVFNR
eukprot:CAMPEP_0119506916 /NCGR_PEP_ID=MMETSP1344-20130328/26980_1 /TAXON_ID=236787 /ORGANISM="Florenciella parvula, Strain CCMP2471" /LENGTH=203 /DNA_ID=CAMNT_0007543495 /DNA_START=53 /DNA_END=660 /DNA_ORIENTATION=+